MKQSMTLTSLLNITHPIIQAGMAGATTPELVATISNEGGLGTIGAGYMSLAQLNDEIDNVTVLTKKPFAANLFVPENTTTNETSISKMHDHLQYYYNKYKIDKPYIKHNIRDHFNSMIDLIISKHVPIISFTFGIPDASIIQKLKAHQIKIIGSASSVHEAVICEKAGMDIIVAQGYEAGGHRANFNTNAHIGLMSLIPQVVDEVSIPVIAAGGIMDKRGINAAIALGAAGVQMGTAFLTSYESKAPAVHKEAITASTETDTTLTKAISGKEARGIKNQLIVNLEQYYEDILPYPYQNDLTSPFRKLATQHNNAADLHLWCGQTPRLANINYAKDIFRSLI
ncbi:NAD(P)H-dependent flavin oxidoreductase [Macrococcus armenti]|uniref:NAD(P)H-dependent flavin oxidoreductase n=1 Tax=Macrococcus armenti TaxID=2875764 RepID=UPI001CD44181|nr:nitronate monooxygenase family protein [Macrococcus armenti]UBH11235.1 nitronate monooxygenase family protein [Macrococcus armenti]